MEIHEKIGFGVALIFVAYLSAQDIREKRVSVFAIVLFGSIAILYMAAGERLDFVQLSLKILPGVLLLFVALLSEEKIGYGDGAAVLVLGLWTSTFFCLLSTSIGLLMAGIYGGLLMVVKKQNYRIPFLPFLLTAMEVLFVYV